MTCNRCGYPGTRPDHFCIVLDKPGNGGWLRYYRYDSHVFYLHIDCIRYKWLGPPIFTISIPLDNIHFDPVSPEPTIERFQLLRSFQ